MRDTIHEAITDHNGTTTILIDGVHAGTTWRTNRGHHALAPDGTTSTHETHDDAVKMLVDLYERDNDW